VKLVYNELHGTTQGQEVKFYEIKIHFFMRSNFLPFFIRSKFLIIDLIYWSQHFSWDQNCLIMLFRVLISWSLLWLTNRSWDQNPKKHYLQFQSHDQFVSYKYNHEIKIQNKLFKFSKLHLWLIFSPNYWPSVHKNIRSHDRTCS
jgi:hypothetical protein